MNYMLIFLQASTWSEWFVHLAKEINGAVWTSMDRMVTAFSGRLPYLLAGLIVLFLFWLVSRVLRRLVLAAGTRASMDPQLRILMSRIVAGLALIVGVLAMFTVIVPSFDFGSLIAGLGFTSVVVGFAAKDIVNNFLSGILILWQRPFRLGDYVFAGANQGKVEKIGVRATSLRKDDGELILIPNGDMYSSALMIRGKGSKRRMNLKFEIDFDANIDLAKEVTRATIDSTDGVVHDPTPRVLVTEINSTGVQITASFWLNTKEDSPLQVYDRVSRGVLSALASNGIHIFSKNVSKSAAEADLPAKKPKKEDELFG